jgi:hypothetical protein
MPRSKVPPTGWHFMEGDIRLEASIPDELEVVIADYRRVNGLPPGDPHRDLINFICSKFPSHCGKAFVSMTPAQGKAQRPRLLDRVAAWAVTTWRHGKLVHVHQDEAKRRAEICMLCPRHGSWDHCETCGALIKDTKVMCSHLRQGRAAFGGLMGCHEGGFDCSAAVWLKGITTGSNQPANCWAKA